MSPAASHLLVGAPPPQRERPVETGQALVHIESQVGGGRHLRLEAQRVDLGRRRLQSPTHGFGHHHAVPAYGLAKPRHRGPQGSPRVGGKIAVGPDPIHEQIGGNHCAPVHDQGGQQPPLTRPTQVDRLPAEAHRDRPQHPDLDPVPHVGTVPDGEFQRSYNGTAANR